MAGIEPGPGLMLAQARQRLIRAVLTIQLGEVQTGLTGGTYATTLEKSEAYAEMTSAARDLDKAQAAWDEHMAAKERRYVGFGDGRRRP